MSIDCRVFAVREEDVEELRAYPALVLGRALFAGLAWCELRDAGRTIHLILSGRDDAGCVSADSLFPGGTELSLPHHAGDPPRLLNPREVKDLNAVLTPLNEVELQRRFHRQSLVSSILDRLSAETHLCPDNPQTPDWTGDVFVTRAEDFEGDWTLDQAEEFERIAQQVEDLRTFVVQAVGRRQWLVLSLNEVD